MNPLQIFVSAGCAVCARAERLVAEVRALRPAYPVELLNLDRSDVERPAFVFGTPTYVLGGRIVSLGNPPRETLLDLLDAETARSAEQS